MHVVLVHGGDVVENILAVFKHPLHAGVNDRRQLVAVGGVVTDAVRNGCRHQVTVTVLVLQAFTIERGSAGCRSD